MRRTRLSLTCDICEQDSDVETPAERVLVIGEDGKVRALDLCEGHNAAVKPSELQNLSVLYGTPLIASIDRHGRITTVSNGRTPRQAAVHVHTRDFHEPGGAWDGSYVGPVTCLVPIDDGRPCGQQCKNVVGLKKHQWGKHGITVKRDA